MLLVYYKSTVYSFHNFQVIQNEYKPHIVTPALQIMWTLKIFKKSKYTHHALLIGTSMLRQRRVIFKYFFTFVAFQATSRNSQS